MKRNSSILLLAAGAALFAISGYAQEAQDNQTLVQRVELLEKELEQTKATLQGLSEAAVAQAAETDAITKYVQQQSEAAARMVDTLSSSESQGFVKGINFTSRETLLSGWRTLLGSAQKGVPGARPEEPGPVNTRRRR